METRKTEVVPPNVISMVIEYSRRTGYLEGILVGIKYATSIEEMQEILARAETRYKELGGTL